MHDRSACAPCHYRQSRHYDTTPHANSCQTLVSHGAQENAECLSCHTTGFGREGGVISLRSTPRLKDVSCVECHEEVATADLDQHKTQPTGKAITIKICQKCHTAQWSPEFDFSLYRDYVSHRDVEYVIKEGDWLCKVALRYYGAAEKWRTIHEANEYNVDNPNLIFPGQVIIIPKPRPRESCTSGALPLQEK
ncbi:MAG: multiheme c-type cytochrome [Armatimonadota bacterium]